MLGLVNPNESRTAAKGTGIACAGRVAAGLVGSPLAADIGAAPALVAVLNAGIIVKTAIARLPALGNAQRRVSVGVEVDVKNGKFWVLDIAAHVSPGCRRGP